MRAAGLLLAGLLTLGAAPGLAAAPAGAPTLSLHYEGTLKEAMRRVAKAGHINLVITGGLDQPAQVDLEGVDAQEALESLAHAYHFRIERQGSIWTLSPQDAPESTGPAAVPAVSFPPAPPAPAVTPPPVAKATPPADQDSDGNADSDADQDSDPFQGDNSHGLSKSSGDVVGESVTVDENRTVRGAVALGGPLEILGHVTGDAVAVGGTLHLGPHARVDGDVTAVGGNLIKDPGAQIGGTQVRLGLSGIFQSLGIQRHLSQLKVDSPRHPLDPTVVRDSDASEHTGQAWVIPGLVLRFALYFGLGFLFLMFAPTRLKQLEGELVRDPVRCGVTGLLAALALFPLTVMLVITFVGIPVALALWLVVAVAIAMGMSALAYEIGFRLPLLRGSGKTQAAVLALGVGVLILFEHLPVIGWIVLAVATLLALGAAVRTRLGATPRGFPEPL